MGSTTWRVVAGAGVVAGAVGVIEVRRHTPPCANFDVKVQFAGTDERLAAALGRCPADIDGVRRALSWDYLLMAGYASALGGALMALARRGVLPTWWAAVPVAAATADAVENVLLLGTLEIRDGRLAFPVGSGRARWIPVAAGVKFAGLGAAVLGTIVWWAVRGSGN